MNQYPSFDQGLHYNDLHEDHKNWLTELEFCKKEIAFFQHSLEDFTMKLTNADKGALIEQLQNKLIIHNEQVDILLHEIKLQEVKLNAFIKSHEQNIEFITFSDHKAWREKIEINRKLYNEMKQDFYHGISQKKNNLMKTLLINDTQKLKEIKDAFNANYPHLKIEFFSEEHKTGEASSRKAMYDDSLVLKDIRKNHTAGELSIDGHQKTSTFETNFYNHFGVTVQVFRKSGNIWLQTTTTDDWSLAHQEKTGQEFDN